MYIGLDVGGTNTDAVLLNTAYEVVKGCKVATTHDNVGHGIISALQQLLAGQKPENIHRVCVSSTLALNALLTNRHDRTGLILVPGPGLAPPPEWQTPLVKILSGAQDHLGNIIAKPDKEQVLEALKSLQKQDIKALAIVTKFSPKNPALEEWLYDMAQKFFNSGNSDDSVNAGDFGNPGQPDQTDVADRPDPAGQPPSATLSPALPIVLGSSLSGTLNFPRRVATAWFQAALTNINCLFIAKLNEALRDLGLNCPLDILKADGGTFPHTMAALNPANSIGSGPAASILGALPEAPAGQDSAVISIGGTTTDIALLAKGDPLMLKEGLIIDGKATLVKGMHTKSIALGGDSSLALEQGKILIKPERLGPAICLAPEDLGKRPPTLTDALRVTHHHDLGDENIAREALMPLAEQSACSVDEVALGALQTALETLATTLADFVDELNSQPVYTIREIQYTEPIQPDSLILIGAPAPALAKPLAQALGLPVIAPENADIANAVGAALARPTVDAELYADTGTKLMSIAPYGITKSIDSRYSMEEAQSDLTTALQNALRVAYARHSSLTSPQNTSLQLASNEKPLQPDDIIQIVFAETFHTLSGYGDRGKIFRLKAQVSPGLLATREEI